MKNWAGNFSYQTSQVSVPSSVEEVQRLVESATKIKALGSRHSFNDIADSSHHLVSTERLNQVLSLDPEAMTVTVQSGIKYGELGIYLAERGYAIHNYASLPHISVAGACATATHGSGDGNGNLATAVVGIRFVVGDGSIVSLTTQDPDFDGAVVALGAWGIVTELTLRIQSAFEVYQTVFEGLPYTDLEKSFDSITSSAYSVSLFTDWRGDEINQVWRKSLSPVSAEFFGARPATQKLHPIREIDPINCTDQLGVPGPSHDRLPHFRMAFTPSSGEELQSEFLVPRAHAVPALAAVRALAPEIAPLLLISEVRTMAADELWLSPCYRTPCIGIHFTWLPKQPEVLAFLPSLEQALIPFEARPHWGKLFTTPGDVVMSRYPMVEAFRAGAQKYDTTRKFRNAFLDRVVFGE